MPGSRPPGTSKRGRLADGGGCAGCTSSPSSTSNGRFNDSLVELEWRMRLECNSDVPHLFRLTMPESNCFCLLTTGAATCGLPVIAGRATADDASISFCALCIMKSRKTNERNPREVKGKSSSATSKRIFSILRFLPVPGVSVRVAFRSSPDRYEPRSLSRLRPDREWSFLRRSRRARIGE